MGGGNLAPPLLSVIELVRLIFYTIQKGSWCSKEINCKQWTYKKTPKLCILYHGSKDENFSPQSFKGSISGYKDCNDFPCPMIPEKFIGLNKMPIGTVNDIDNWQDCGK